MKNTFRVEGKGLLLSGGSKPKLKGVDFRTNLKLVLPDGSTLFTSVVGINCKNGDLIVSNGDDLNVPNKTEVWLNESKE